MLVSERIKQKLEKSLEIIEIQVIDESHLHAGHAGAREGGESHFAVSIISNEFKGLSRVQCHKLIYKILDEEIKNGVHALRISASAPK